MSEKIYVLDENGSILGLQDRQYVHEHGILHSAVQCWIMNSEGKVLIQRRAATKDKSAGKWDVSFGGHCVESDDTNDILIYNVIKEGKEGLGLTINPQNVIKLGEVRYTSQENKNNELLGIFLIKVNNNQKFVFEGFCPRRQSDNLGQSHQSPPPFCLLPFQSKTLCRHSNIALHLADENLCRQTPLDIPRQFQEFC